MKKHIKIIKNESVSSSYWRGLSVLSLRQTLWTVFHQRNSYDSQPNQISNLVHSLSQRDDKKKISLCLFYCLIFATELVANLKQPEVKTNTILINNICLIWKWTKSSTYNELGIVGYWDYGFWCFVLTLATVIVQCISKIHSCPGWIKTLCKESGKLVHWYWTCRTANDRPIKSFKVFLQKIIAKRVKTADVLFWSKDGWSF